MSHLKENGLIRVSFKCNKEVFKIKCESDDECNVMASDSLKEYKYKYKNGKLTKLLSLDVDNSKIDLCNIKNENQIKCKLDSCKKAQNGFNELFKKYEAESGSCNLQFKSCENIVKNNFEIFKNQCTAENISEVESESISNFLHYFSRVLDIEYINKNNINCLDQVMYEQHDLINENKVKYLNRLKDEIKKDLSGDDKSCSEISQKLSPFGKQSIDEYICVKSAEAGYSEAYCATIAGGTSTIVVPTSNSNSEGIGNKAAKLAANVTPSKNAEIIEQPLPMELKQTVPIKETLAEIQSIDSNPNISNEEKASLISIKLDGFYNGFSKVISSTEKLFDKINPSGRNSSSRNTRSQGQKEPKAKDKEFSVASRARAQEHASKGEIIKAEPKSSAMGSMGSTSETNVSEVGRKPANQSSGGINPNGGVTNPSDNKAVGFTNNSLNKNDFLPTRETQSTAEVSISPEGKDLFTKILDANVNPYADDIISLYYQDEGNKGFKELISLLDQRNIKTNPEQMIIRLVNRLNELRIKIIDTTKTKASEQVIVNVQEPNYVIFKTSDGLRVTKPSKAKK